MKIAIILSSHIDCPVRAELLSAMINSVKESCKCAAVNHPDVETQLFVRVSAVDNARGALANVLPDLTVYPRQSQFQKIRTEFQSETIKSWSPQYYVFVDDDDLVAPNLLSSYIRYLKRIDQPLDPRCVVAESEYYVNAVNETDLRSWPANVSGVDPETFVIAALDFSGICVSDDMVREFIDLFESEIDSGVGTVDRSFTHRVKKNARYRIQIPEPLVYYRQWDNPRSWKTSDF